MRYADFSLMPSGGSPTNSNGELLTVAEVADLLKCSPRHIRNSVKRGEFPEPIRLGRLPRWPRETVLQWISAQNQGQA